MTEKTYAAIERHVEYFDAGNDWAVTGIARQLDIARPVETDTYRIGNISLGVEPAGGNDLRVSFSCSFPVDGDASFFETYPNGIEEH